MCANRFGESCRKRVLLLWMSDKFQKHIWFEVPSDPCDLVTLWTISISERVIFFTKGVEEVDEKWGKDSWRTCCKERRKHVFQRRTGKIVCAHTAWRGTAGCPWVAIVPRYSASPLSPVWKAGAGGWQHVHCWWEASVSVCDFSSWEWCSWAKGVALGARREFLVFL